MPQPDDRSFRKLLPGFVISAGTQVVLKVAKALRDGQQFKPAGSVGLVLESPPNNHGPYVVHFTDGESATPNDNGKNVSNAVKRSGVSELPHSEAFGCLPSLTATPGDDSRHPASQAGFWQGATEFFQT